MAAGQVFPETADIETSSDDYARRFAGPVGAWFLDVQNRATLDMLAPYPGASVLDVGGGHGQITGALVGAGHAVTVIGSDQACRARIQEYVQTGQVEFAVGNLIDLPYPDQAFDVVVSYRLLPHVERWPELIVELCRVARQAVVVDYPEARSVNAITPLLFGVKKKMEGNTRPYTLFRQPQLMEHFVQHGFVYADRQPEFFWPMVLHRVMKSVPVSRALEGAARAVGLTRALGSPVVLKVARQGNPRA